MNIDRLEWHLGNWVTYMHRPSSRLGYPSRSMCISSGGDSCIDEFDIMCEEMDTDSARKFDAMIDSLRPPQKVAINHVWLHTTHWYPHTHAMDYDDAINSLITLAEKRGLI